ncbi:endo-alpha-N-acetylgalactosaminidase family protein [Peribacillus kribbensis]|uniref:endo-alpha-N-acetylgalactosaminidase family protein n=1 Tax=Peribacillus kribbensis TaxID=356658 RepID=UPI000414F1EB|nr:endo-alpha-N-acetylgalactosaminidase family protein [Peribacillus kribbensis]
MRIKILSSIMSAGLAIPLLFTSQFGVSAQERVLKEITLSADKTAVNLDGTTKLQLTGVYSDGSTENLSGSDVQYTISNPNVLASVQKTDEGAIVRAGTITDGEAAVTATVHTESGETKTASIPIKVNLAPDRPFIHNYHETLTMKMFMADNNGTVFRTFEQGLETIKKVDRLTRGIPKIIYLVGWQYNGHDTGYPAWDVVNPNLKREQDPSAADSLKWLMKEAYKYNTTVSLHINMLDIRETSPLWQTYLENDLIAKNADGKLVKYKWGYPISYTREWETGFAQKRIDGLLDMLPIEKAGTIHIDAFHQYIPGLPVGPISPGHGVSMDQDIETQKKIIRYWRDHGVDVTSEMDAGYRKDPLMGLQPLAWHFGRKGLNGVKIDQLKVPASLYVGGDGGDSRYGQSMLGENIIKADPETLTGFQTDFATKTLPWQYLNQLKRLSDLNGVVTFENNVKSWNENGKLMIKQDDRTIRDGNDLFVPALWNQDKYMEIIAFSKDGFENKTWKLPEGWKDVKKVDIYSVGLDGLTLLKKNQKISDGEMTFSLDKEQTISIFPHNANLNK